MNFFNFFRCQIEFERNNSSFYWTEWFWKNRPIRRAVILTNFFVFCALITVSSSHYLSGRSVLLQNVTRLLPPPYVKPEKLMANLLCWNNTEWYNTFLVTQPLKEENCYAVPIYPQTYLSINFCFAQILPSWNSALSLGCVAQSTERIHERHLAT